MNKPLGLNIIDMIDIEYCTDFTAYSISVPVYYNIDEEKYIVFLNIDKKTTIITECNRFDRLGKEISNSIRNYFRGKNEVRDLS